MSTIHSEKGTKQVLIAVPDPIGPLLDEMSFMLADAFGQNGFMTSVSPRIEPTLVARSDVCVLFGDIARLMQPISVFRSRAPRPPVVLWQLDSLAPPGIGRDELTTAVSAEHLRSRLRLPTGAVGKLIRRVVPQHLRNRAKRRLVLGVTGRAPSSVKGMLPEGEEPRGLRRYERVRLIKSGIEEGWLDHVFVSTPERVQTLEGVRVSSTFLPVGYHPSLGRQLRIDRDLCSVFFGKMTPRRIELISNIRRSLPDLPEKGILVEDEVWGDARDQSLSRAKCFLVINPVAGFWELPRIRIIMAAACGCLPIAEECGTTEPFVPGKHFVSVPSDDLADALRYYWSHDEERKAMVQRLQDLVMSELTMDRVPSRMLTQIGFSEHGVHG